MKKRSYLFFILLFLLVIILSCDNNKNLFSPTSDDNQLMKNLKIDKGNITNEEDFIGIQFELTGVSTEIYKNLLDAYYDPNSGYTYINGREGSTEMSAYLSILVPGNSIGSWDQKLAQLNFFTKDGTLYAPGGRTGSCTITITKYGSTGEYIEGTFFGVVINGEQAPGPLSYTIKNGIFKIKRGPDIQIYNQAIRR